MRREESSRYLIPLRVYAGHTLQAGFGKKQSHKTVITSAHYDVGKLVKIYAHSQRDEMS